MKRAWKWARGALIAAFALVAVVYIGDYLYVRYRATRSQPGDPFDVVTLQPTYAIAQKDGRAEIILGQAETRKCVHALFPHNGYMPCWYLNRQNGKIQVIGGGIIF